MEEWRAALAERGFRIVHEEQLEKTMEFATWAGRHDLIMQRLLRSMLEHATPKVAAILVPQNDGEKTTFRLREGLFVAQRT